MKEYLDFTRRGSADHPSPRMLRDAKREIRALKIDVAALTELLDLARCNAYPSSLEAVEAIYEKHWKAIK